MFDFGTVQGRSVVGAFDGGVISSDAGALLLGATDRAIRLVRRFADCFSDGRDADSIEHTVATLVGQRLFAMALGYEDLNDHDELRHDPIMAVLAGKLKARRKSCAPWRENRRYRDWSMHRRKGRPLHRHATTRSVMMEAAIAELFVTLFLEAHARPPQRIILDLDATDNPLHGHQEGRFFHGYYDCYCYLPLYIFCGRHLLAAKLRRSNIDASAGSREEVARIVAQIRSRWPKVEIWLRADSGFAREELMAWCEENHVEYVFGLARNERLVAKIARELKSAEKEAAETGRPARRFKEFKWSTLKSWSRRRRVIAKAEWTKGEANPRFIVTSLHQAQVSAQLLYEDIYCARGDMENRIKECQADLFADRTPAATMRANQLRLWFASMAYVLMCALRRIGLAGTELARATCGTIRLKLLKIGAQVTISVRRVKIALASSHPWQQMFALAHARLRPAAA